MMTCEGGCSFKFWNVHISGAYVFYGKIIMVEKVFMIYLRLVKNKALQK
jgi:hypothetical protein